MADKMATRQAYGKALVELGEKHPELVVMDADLSKSTMTAEFGKVYPERFFNMGIAEQNLQGGNSHESEIPSLLSEAVSAEPQHLQSAEKVQKYPQGPAVLHHRHRPQPDH